MTPRPPLLPSLLLQLCALLAAGCYSPSDYNDDVSQARCQLWSDCDYFEQLDYEEMDECIYYQTLINDPDNSDTYPQGCDFDRERAIDCIEGTNQMVCEDLSDNDYPISCDQVCTRGQ